MKCQRCGSSRVISAGAKCADRFSAHIASVGAEYDGYVPTDVGLGGGDYMRAELCLDCGQVQGKFPLPASRMEEGVTGDEEGED